MFKGHEFYSVKPTIWKKGLYLEEKNLIHEFLGGVESCMGLKYDTETEARNAMQALKRHCKKISTQPVNVCVRREMVYITKEE